MVPLISNASHNHRMLQTNAPSLRAGLRCTCLNSQHSRASEFAVELLGTRRENFAGGNLRLFSEQQTPPPPCQAEERTVVHHRGIGRDVRPQRRHHLGLQSRALMPGPLHVPVCKCEGWPVRGRSPGRERTEKRGGGVGCIRRGGGAGGGV